MKGRKENYPVSLIWLLIAVFFAIAFANAAWASDRITQSNDQNLQTTGDVSMGTGDAFGIGNALGDVDIGDCVVTKQTSIILVAWQRYEENPWCQAVVMYQLGQLDTAERILCRDTNIGTYYADEVECREAIDLAIVAEAIAETVPDDHLEDEEEWHEEQQQLQQDYEERFAVLEARVNRPTPKPQIIEQTVQQPYLSDAKKAALSELIE